MTNFTLGDNMLDSQDIIKRIEALREGVGAMVEACDDSEDGKELALLREIEKQCEGCGDWKHGETLIRDTFFVEYITDLIGGCYDMPTELSSGGWPWRHMSIDYEAAAEDAKDDYIDVEIGPYLYYMRAD